jgi:hypothetical protein
MRDVSNHRTIYNTKTFGSIYTIVFYTHNCPTIQELRLPMPRLPSS